MMNIPTVETKRLRLRPFQASDKEAYAQQVYSDPDVMRYLGVSGTVPENPLEHTRKVIERHNQKWAEQGFGAWALTLRETNELMGHAGLYIIPDSEVIEIAYAIGKAYWGYGYATEAARAVMQFAFEVIHLDTLVGVAFEGNVASQHVMQKLGMRPLGLTNRYYGIDMMGFMLTRDEYFNQNGASP